MRKLNLLSLLLLLIFLLYCRCELKVSEPLVSFREGITNSTASDNFTATSQTPRLPPPWSELLDSKWHTLVPIDASKIAGAKARLVMNSENLSLTFRCFPLPSTLISLLEREMDSAEKINAQVEKHFRDDEAAGNHDSSRNQKDSFTLLLNFWKEYNTATGTALENSELVDPILCATNEKVDRVMNFVCSGPRGVNTNVLHVSPDFAIEIFTAKVPPNQIAHTESTPVGNSSTILGNATAPDVQEEESAAAVAELLYEPVQFKDRPDIVKKVWDRVRSSVIAGFNEATAAGPLMHEPLHGVGVVLEKVELNYSLADTILTFEDYSSMSLRSDCSQADKLQRFKGSSSNSFVSGQLISEVSDTIQLAMLGCPLRLIEPIYQCDLQCDQQQLGNLYSVLAKRRGEVVKEDIIEGTSLFLLTAHLPVANSFGFAQELLKKTSGSGTAPQLHFSHWQTIDQDPFWRPTTEDEKEEFGDTTGTVVEKNLPRNFIDNVRKRKGLQIEEKIVVFAEKQRTLNKKK